MAKLLSRTGFPFQDWCAEVVRRSPGYSCVAEYPYTWPPTNGNMIGTPGSIDIVAATANIGDSGHPALFGKGVTYLAVECKRADSRIKNWVFSAVPAHARERSRFVSRRFSGGMLGGEPTDVPTHEVTFPELGYSDAQSYEAVVAGFELDDRMSHLNRNEEERMYKHLKQVNTGLKALTVCREPIDGLSLPVQHPHALYLPVLVTTAHLYLFSHDPREVRIPEGELDVSKMELEEQQWLTYLFPLPDYVPYFGGRFSKMPTFIVNAEHWEEFLRKVRPVYRVDRPAR
jgi:hypothetical protein